MVIGDYRGAAARFINYWGGPGAWEALRPSVQDALTRWAPKAPLDFHALIEEPTPASAYAVLRFPVLGAYELALKCSHTFNLLDARGAISVTERVGVMARIRNLIVGVAKIYAEQQRLTLSSATLPNPVILSEARSA